MRTLSAILLIVLAIGLALSESVALFLSGFRPLETPSVAALDDPRQLDNREGPRLLDERNRVELVVPRSITVGDLLDLYQIDFPHVREQIAEQEGLATVTDDYRLEEGHTFVLELTPVREEVP